MFINLSNHPSDKWNEQQLSAAHEYGEVVDLPYPQINPSATEEDIHKIVVEYLRIILETKPDAIMVCGEFNFTFEMVDALLLHGVNVITAASGRDTLEIINPDGTSTKTSNFHFYQFRKYQHYNDFSID